MQSTQNINHLASHVASGLGLGLGEAKQGISIETQSMLQVQKNQLSALGRIAVNIAHELTQPIAAIRLLAENSLSENASADFHIPLAESRKNLTRIVNIAETLSIYIHQLKHFSRLDPVETSIACMQSIIANVQSVVEAKRKECDAILTFHIDDALVYAQSSYVSAILVNIICNAFDAIARAENREVTVTAKKSSQMLMLSVRDNGSGLSSDVLGHLFRPFKTTKSANNSLGIGLEISNDIASQMGVHLDAKNHPDGGTEFSFTLSLVNYFT